MTENQKYKLLKHIKRKDLKRFEVEKFCTGKTEFDRECEIESLCINKMIVRSSHANFVNGVFKADPEDTFGIGDSGNDYLANIKKDYIRTYLPISISILSLVVATSSLIVTIIKVP